MHGEEQSALCRMSDAFVVYSRFVSNYENRHQLSPNTTTAYDTSSLQNVFTLHVTDNILPQHVFNSLYLLQALAGVICMFLFIIVMKLFVRSKSREGQRGNDTDNKSQFQLQKEIHTSYDTESESLRKIPVYEPLKAEYEGVNEQIHIHCSSSIRE